MSLQVQCDCISSGMTWLYTIKARDMTAKDVFRVINLPYFRDADNEDAETYDKLRWGADIKFEKLPKLLMTTNVQRCSDNAISRLMSTEAQMLQKRLLKELDEYLPSPDQDALIAMMCDPVMMTAGRMFIFARGGADRELWESSWSAFEEVVIDEAKRALVACNDHNDTDVRQILCRCESSVFPDIAVYVSF